MEGRVMTRGTEGVERWGRGNFAILRRLLETIELFHRVI